MSLVRFKGSNHPQQTSTRGVRPDIDCRATDPLLFEVFNRRWHFTVDVAALPHNAKLERFYSPADDGLTQDWAGERVWCNPPYSDIEPWVEKAWASDAELVVMLLPANRTEQGWWQRHVEPFRDRRGGVSIEFLPGRIRFIADGAEGIGKNERPPFGCVLLIWEDWEGRPGPSRQLALGPEVAES
jgi:phage N-6-adenine-methyltransferase